MPAMTTTTKAAHTADTTGRPYAKLSELKAGDVLVADGGFTCLKEGARRIVKRRAISRELYIDCADHGHALVGQADDGEHLIGLHREPTIGLGLNRNEYWSFLRRVYGMGAIEAWDYIKRVGAPPSAGDIRAAIAKAGGA